MANEGLKSEGSDAAHHLENSLELSIDAAHREYLLSRHGTLELNPVPSSSPADPLNWPIWKKNTQIILVAFHSMTATFMAAGIIPGFMDFAKAYGTSVNEASYLTSVQILFLGIFPVLWSPIAARFGRRPIFILSALGSMVCNIAGACARTYGSQMTTRVLTAICISPAIGIGSAVVTELFFSHERAQKMGWWTLLITVGIPGGPFIMGFVVQHLGVDWIFWIFAIINFCQLAAYLLLNAETLYLRVPTSDPKVVERKPSHFSFSRIDPSPLTFSSFISPFYLSRYASIIIPVCSYAVVFCYANIAITVEMPIIFGEKFHLGPESIGLQFIALIIGSVIGEQLSGPLSDAFLRRRSKKIPARPEARLWISYIGFLTVIIGILVWGIRIQQAKEGEWNVTPLIGAAIAAFGNQIITTTLITYAVDKHKNRSAEIGVLVNFVRQIWGFIGPFYFPDMFQKLGYAGSAGLMGGVVFVFATVPIIVLQFLKSRERE